MRGRNFWAIAWANSGFFLDSARAIGIPTNVAMVTISLIAATPELAPSLEYLTGRDSIMFIVRNLPLKS